MGLGTVEPQGCCSMWWKKGVGKSWNVEWEEESWEQEVRFCLHMDREGGLECMTEVWAQSTGKEACKLTVFSLPRTGIHADNGRP